MPTQEEELKLIVSLSGDGLNQLAKLKEGMKDFGGGAVQESTNKLKESLGQLEKVAGTVNAQFGEAFKTMGLFTSGSLATAAGIAGVSIAAIKAIKDIGEFANSMRELKRSAEALGTSPGSLKHWENDAAAAGKSVDFLRQSLQNMNAAVANLQLNKGGVFDQFLKQSMPTPGAQQYSRRLIEEYIKSSGDPVKQQELAKQALEYMDKNLRTQRDQMGRPLAEGTIKETENALLRLLGTSRDFLDIKLTPVSAQAAKDMKEAADAGDRLANAWGRTVESMKESHGLLRFQTGLMDLLSGTLQAGDPNRDRLARERGGSSSWGSAITDFLNKYFTQGIPRNDDHDKALKDNTEELKKDNERTRELGDALKHPSSYTGGAAQQGLLQQAMFTAPKTAPMFGGGGGAFGGGPFPYGAGATPGGGPLPPHGGGDPRGGPSAFPGPAPGPMPKAPPSFRPAPPQTGPAPTTTAPTTTATGTTQGVTPEGMALLDTIATREAEPAFKGGARAGWTTMVGGERFDPNTEEHPHKAYPGMHGFVGGAGRSYASGRYQETTATYYENVKRSQALHPGMHVTGWSPEAQNIRNWDKAQEVYGQHYRELGVEGLTGNLQKDLETHKDNPAMVGRMSRALHYEWTSAPGGHEAAKQTGGKEAYYGSTYEKMLAATSKDPTLAGKDQPATGGRQTAGQAGITPKFPIADDADWKDLDAEYVTRLNKVYEAAPADVRGKMLLHSGYRPATKEEARKLGLPENQSQEWLWEDSQHGKKYAAAAPGKSKHQSRMAGDFWSGPDDPNRADYGAAAWLALHPEFGLKGIGKHDPGHIELDEARKDIDAAGVREHKVTGNGKLDVNVKAPPNTSVKAEGDGIFKTTNVTRQTQMQPASRGPAVDLGD